MIKELSCLIDKQDKIKTKHKINQNGGDQP